MLNGKNAVVTGAGSGIGLAVTEKLAKHGVNIWAVVHHLDEDCRKRFERIESEEGVWVHGVEAEFEDVVSVEQACRAIVSEKETLDILINNAGMPYEKTLGMTSIEDMEKVMFVNFMMPSHIMQIVSRKMMRQKEGVVVNMISRSALENRSGVYAYGASKAALLWGTKAAAKELSPFNIRVNGIAPGLVETKMGTGSRSKEATERYVSGNNIRRPATVDEIANVAVFLASEESSYISGQVISVDGGRD